MKKGVLLSSMFMAASLVSGNAMSVTVSQYFDGVNDCAGYFGDSFDACQIFIMDDGQRIELSPVIAKYDYNDDGSISGIETNDAVFPTVSGGEFTIDVSGGSWAYAPDDLDDPGVRFWSAKGGNGFNLFWEVDAAELEMGGACYGGTYTLECMSAAMIVDAGDFLTPDGKGLSHLVFYDSENPQIVPLPASIWLMGAGLIGLAGVARRK